jgi:sulfite exporter TauE/SafE
VRFSIPVSSLLIIFGIGYAVLAIKLRRRSRYLFFAALFFQTGVFLLLNALDIIRAPQVWPLFSIFTGIALLFTGWHRYKAFKVNYAVLSATFVILGVIMIVFALDLLPFSLAQFVRNWWPLLVLLAVLLLALLLIGTKYRRKRL